MSGHGPYASIFTKRYDDMLRRGVALDHAAIESLQGHLNFCDWKTAVKLCDLMRKLHPNYNQRQAAYKLCQILSQNRDAAYYASVNLRKECKKNHK